MKVVRKFEQMQLTLAQNKEVKEKAFEPKCLKDLEKSGFLTITGKIPGNFELDLLREGIIDDPYYSTNPIKIQIENFRIP